MSRLDIMTPSHSQTVIDGLYRDVERRIAASPPGLCPVDLAKSFLDLCHAQTCGKCVPCRIGTTRMKEILDRICEGKGQEGDIELLEELCVSIKDGALCGLGQTAPNPVLTTIRYFRDEYEAHIRDKKCPAHEFPPADHFHRPRQVHRLHRLRPEVPGGVHQRGAERAPRHQSECLYQV